MIDRRHESHRERGGSIYFTVTDRLFLGPKRRAYTALRNPLSQVLKPEAFVDYLDKTLPDCYDQIERITFHSFANAELPDATARIAVILTSPSPRVRDRLYELRVSVTNATGWYPVVQGSHARFLPYQDLLGKIRRSAPSQPLQPVGMIQEVRAIANSDKEGSAFEVVGSVGSWLLDTGMLRDLSHTKGLAGTFVTHSHKDHSGGIWSVVDACNSSVLLSEATLTSLWSVREVTPSEKIKLLRRCRPCLGNEVLHLSDGTEVELFPGFHAPGALGVRINDPVGNVVVYFGDLCLRNGFYDYREEALRMVMKGDAVKRWVILDATMAGKKVETIEAGDTPEEILRQAAEGVLKRNVAFVSSQPETLVYTYLSAFYLTQGVRETAIRFLVSQDAFQLIRAIFRPVSRKQADAVDPLAAALVGASLTSNFAESHRLYPLSPVVLKELPKEEPVVILAQPGDLHEVEGLSERIHRSNTYFVGNKAVRSELPESLNTKPPRLRLTVDAPNWSFHSSEEDLIAFLKTLTASGVRVGLFHQYPKELRRFIKKHGLDPNLVTVMADQPLVIGQGSGA